MYVFDDFFNPLSTRCGEYTPHVSALQKRNHKWVKLKNY